MYAQRRAERSFKTESYAQKIQAAEVKIAQARSEATALAERARLASEVEAKRRQLERLQVGSQLNLLQATDTRVEYEAKLATAKSQLLAAQRELESLLAERDDEMQQWLADTSQQLTEQGRKLAEGRELLNKASLRRQLVRLRAPRDGVVLRVAPVSAGTVMQSGDPFIELVPLDAPLQIEAIIDGSDVGFVRVGDRVTIKFDTFPYPLHGTAVGTLRSVSPDSFKDPTAAPTKDLLVKQSQEPTGILFFRAKISLDEVRLHDLPDAARIVPGMPVQADIIIGERSALRYMMSRFIPVATESARQP
jgi:HlyD family secretion protein